MNDFVSIIIPERNEIDHIEECIDSVIRQSYSKDLVEVLVIDGMSFDGTREIIEKYCNKHHFIRLFDNPSRIVPCALNIGIKEAKGNIIIRLDAHTYYDKNYVMKCVKTLNEVEAVNVGGRIITLPGDNTLIAKAISIATSNIFGVGNSKFRTTTKAQYVDTVPFGAFRREVFKKVGLFNECLLRNQDIELNSRIIQSGGKIYLNPEIKAFYYNQSTLRGLWKQNFGNGMWNVFTLAINKRGLSLRHFVPLAFIMSLFGSLILSIFFPIIIFLFMFILVIYLIANITISLTISMKKHFKSILIYLSFFPPSILATVLVIYGGF